MWRSMSGLGIVFLVLAVLAALLGFEIILNESWYAAKMCFLGCLVLAVLSLMWAWMSRSWTPARY